VRFYRRRRFWAWSGIGVIGLVLLALLAVYWLLQTVAGRDVLLAQVVARLPVGASFTWDKVDGPVAAGSQAAAGQAGADQRDAEPGQE
jgi:translocation and assembly module TamB